MAQGAVVDYLKYIIGLDTGPLASDARGAENIVGSMTSKITGLMTKMATAIGVGFGAYKLVDFIKGATLTTARLEEMDIVLKTVGESAGYSLGYLKQEEERIKGLGITTQASRELLIRFMQSELDVADAAKIARAAQDFAVIGMMDSSQAAEQLTFAIAAQEPRILRQFGIVTDLSEVFGKYAKSLGKSAEALTEHEKRTALFNVIMENAARVTGTYEAAMTTAGKQLRSLPRYFEEASAKIGQYFMPVLRALTRDLTNFLKPLGYSDDDPYGIRNAFKRLGEITLGVYEKVKNFLLMLLAHLPQIETTIKALIALEIAKWIYGIVTAMKALQTKTLVGLVATIAVAAAAATGALDAIFGYVDRLMDKLLDIPESVATGNEAFRETITVLEKLKALSVGETMFKLPTGEMKKIEEDAGELYEQLSKLTQTPVATLDLWKIEQMLNYYRSQIPEAQKASGKVQVDTEKDTQGKLADAKLEGMVKCLDLEKKYEIKSYEEHIQGLKNILASENLTADQRLKLQTIISDTETEHNLSFNEKLKGWMEKRIEEIKTETEKKKQILDNEYQWEYDQGEMNLEAYKVYLAGKLVAAEKYSDEWMAIMAKIKAVQDGMAQDAEATEEKKRRDFEETWGFVIAGYDTFWQTILDSHITGSERLKAIMDSMAQELVASEARELKKSIINWLIANKVITEGRKSAVIEILSGSVKVIAALAKEGWEAVKAAAKFIYKAVASIYSAHAWIPFVGVAIAAGLVALMMKTINKFAKFAEGGLVTGLAKGKDKILAALTVGEYIVRKPVVEAIGVPALAYMNRTGQMPGQTVIKVDMGGFTFAGMSKTEAFLTETFITDRVVKAIKDALAKRKLRL